MDLINQPNTKLISNTYKFIDTLLKNEKKYEALNDFLEKKHPNIKGIKAGEKIIKSNEFNKEIPSIISNLTIVTFIFKDHLNRKNISGRLMLLLNCLNKIRKLQLLVFLTK